MKISGTELMHLSREVSPATVLSAVLSYILTFTAELPNGVALVSIAAISVTVHLLAIFLKARLKERERELRVRHDMAERLGVAFFIIGNLNAICKDVPPIIDRSIKKLMAGGVYGDSESVLAEKEVE
jgi:hypothetical protein